jgi:hypothetical protein
MTLPQIIHKLLRKGRITNALPSTLVYAYGSYDLPVAWIHAGAVRRHTSATAAALFLIFYWSATSCVAQLSNPIGLSPPILRSSPLQLVKHQLFCATCLSYSLSLESISCLIVCSQVRGLFKRGHLVLLYIDWPAKPIGRPWLDSNTVIGWALSLLVGPHVDQ